MNIFYDNLEMYWNFQEGVPHGNGYGIGDNYVIVGEFVHGKLWGDVTVFCRLTGKRILIAEFEDSIPHGEYTILYEDIEETGIYKSGEKYFVIKKRDNKVFEYGFCKNNIFNGFACIDTGSLTYTSPDWHDGVINGLGCIQDNAGHVIFYGQMKDSVPQHESNDVHPLMLHKYELSRSDPFWELPSSCAEWVLN